MPRSNNSKANPHIRAVSLYAHPFDRLAGEEDKIASVHIKTNHAPVVSQADFVMWWGGQSLVKPPTVPLNAIGCSPSSGLRDKLKKASVYWVKDASSSKMCLVAVWAPEDPTTQRLVAIKHGNSTLFGIVIRAGTIFDVKRPEDVCQQPCTFVDLFFKVRLLSQAKRRNSISFSYANAICTRHPETKVIQLYINFALERSLFRSRTANAGVAITNLCQPGNNLFVTDPSLWLISPAIAEEEHARINHKANSRTQSRLEEFEQWIQACPLGDSVQAALHARLQLGVASLTADRCHEIAAATNFQGDPGHLFRTKGVAKGLYVAYSLLLQKYG